MTDNSTHAPRASSKVRNSEADRHFATLKPVIIGIAATFGRNCEVVLHDFRRPDASIVAIAGSVTDRHVGGSMSQIGLSIFAAGDDAEDQYVYTTRAPNGRVLKSATMPLRDSRRHVFGALCINYDITDLRMLASALEELAGPTRQTPQQVAFVDDVAEVIAETIQEEELSLGRSIDRHDKHDRLEIIRGLDQRGVFSLQRSVPQVAEHLGVSRATLYAYLRHVREDAKQEPRAHAKGE